MKQEVVSFFMEKGFLISPEVLDNLKDEDLEKVFSSLVKNKDKINPSILNNDLVSFLKQDKVLNTKISWKEYDKSKAFLEKGKDGKDYSLFLDILNYEISPKKKLEIDTIVKEVQIPEILEEDEKEDLTSSVVALRSYSHESAKREVGDFVSYFKTRYKGITKILKQRPELNNLTTIRRVIESRESTSCSIIGLVSDKRITKNGHLMFDVEDLTGTIRVLISRESEAYREGKEMVLDEVVGLKGMFKNNLLFCNKLCYPDVNLNKEVKEASEEVYAAFISDVHFGSKLFLEKEFTNLINWLNLNYGTKKQKQISKKLKYLFVVGDLVDGIGVYPEQEKELKVKDIRKQYGELAKYFSMIRKDIKIIICPGQHDALRLAEPQPPLDKDLAKPFWELENVVLVSNPALVNIHASKTFPGFDVLMYHGASYHYYVDDKESLREVNAGDNPTHILKFLLKKRHLAPSHSSTMYIPFADKDPLLIDKVPDVFVSGEMHKSDVGNYNNVILINCSCWQGKTAFQEKVGNNPDFAMVPVLNLKDRKVKLMDFNN